MPHPGQARECWLRFAATPPQEDFGSPARSPTSSVVNTAKSFLGFNRDISEARITTTTKSEVDELAGEAGAKLHRVDSDLD
jgi:hypothetical protein